MKAVRVIHFTVVNNEGVEGGVFTYEKRESSLRVLAGGWRELDHFPFVTFFVPLVPMG
jgi:hypothetical protein